MTVALEVFLGNSTEPCTSLLAFALEQLLDRRDINFANLPLLSRTLSHPNRGTGSVAYRIQESTIRADELPDLLVELQCLKRNQYSEIVRKLALDRLVDAAREAHEMRVDMHFRRK